MSGSTVIGITDFSLQKTLNCCEFYRRDVVVAAVFEYSFERTAVGGETRDSLRLLCPVSGSTRGGGIRHYLIPSPIAEPRPNFPSVFLTLVDKRPGVSNKSPSSCVL